MLISKFDLYRREWLELVFDNRNKEYGAYYLRQHYAGNMIKAMGITFSSLILFIGVGAILKSAPTTVVPIHHDPTIVVTLTDIKQQVAPPKRQIELPRPQAPIKTTQLLQPVVGPDVLAKTPPVNAQITGTIGQTNTPGTVIDPGPIETTPAGTGTQPVIDNSVHPTNGLDVMPEPDGGLNGWSRFLNKNLRFPSEAQDAQISGRVILSFVVEKDGHLSNIVVDRSAGYGFDEEAIRVLKLAKPWKPGMQNGQPVRVKYMIPINFQLADNN
jgi:protein TonB